MDIRAGTCAVSCHSAGGIGYERAVFRGCHYCPVDRYLVADAVGDGLSLSSDSRLNLSQQVTTFAGTFGRSFGLQVGYAGLQCINLRLHVSQLGGAVAPTAPTATG